MRIKVSGYIDTDEAEPGTIDPEQPTGLTEYGYQQLIEYGFVRIAGLADLVVERVDEDS